MTKKVGIVMGSDSDLPVLQKAIDTLDSYGVPYEVHVFSAHRTPEQAKEFALTAEEKGFGAIIAAAGMAANDARLRPLRDRLIAGLREIPHSALNGDALQRLPGNVNFCFEGIEGESLLLLLDDRGICASSGSACTSGSLDPSHVLLAIGRVHDVAHGSLRLTLGEDATEEQVDYLIRNVKEVVEYLRGFSPIWRDLMAGKTQFIL